MTLRTICPIVAVLTLVAAFWPRKKESTEEPAVESPDPASVRITRERLDGKEVLRVRGSFEDVMSALNPSRPVKPRPEVPVDLDLAALPHYYGGCPHCGKTSMCGEGQWRYQELGRTRGFMDNTTTFLVCCQHCRGWMKATVDHDD